MSSVLEITQLTNGDVAPDVMRYEFTVDDPGTFVSSWTARTTMRRTEKVVYEYACHEGNDSMVAKLRGARLHERLAKNRQGKD